MRFITVMGAIAVALAPLAASAADQDFKLINKTGYQIDSVYISQVNVRSWGEDIMGADALADGEVANITFHESARGCKWDLKVAYHDGDTATWSGLDLCDISKVSLFWNKKTEETTATVE